MNLNEFRVSCLNFLKVNQYGFSSTKEVCISVDEEWRTRLVLEPIDLKSNGIENRGTMIKREIDRLSKQHDATYHSEPRFRWKYVSEITSSVCYDQLANTYG